MEISAHRPRNVGWARAGALLYGDWGTSKAYVIGAAFLASQYASLPIIVAVSLLTGIVGYNYVIVCRHFPDGGGVYSSARIQSRLLAVIGALLSGRQFHGHRVAEQLGGDGLFPRAQGTISPSAVWR